MVRGLVGTGGSGGVVLLVVELLEGEQLGAVDGLVVDVGLEAAGVRQTAEELAGDRFLEPGGLGLGLGDDVAVAGDGDPTPLRDVLVGGVDACLALGAVDRPLELGR